MLRFTQLNIPVMFIWRVQYRGQVRGVHWRGGGGVNVTFKNVKNSLQDF